MKDKLINYFFDNYEEYEEVEKYIKLIIILLPISIVLTILINL